MSGQLLLMPGSTCTGKGNKAKCFNCPVTDAEIATPPLSGTILPGVTRMSLLELGATWVRVQVHACMHAHIVYHMPSSVEFGGVGLK